MKRLCILLAILGACDSKKSSRGDDDKKPGCQVAATNVAGMVTGKGPTVLEPFGALKLGSSLDDAKKVCPNFFTGDDAKKTGTFSVGEIVGKFGETYVHGHLEFKNDKIVEMEWKLPPESLDAMTKAWGPPKVATGEKAGHAWHDEATSTRAILAVDYDKSRTLTISSYMPLRAFLEVETARIAWKPQDVLGKTPAELEKQFPQYVGKDTTSEAVKAKTKEMMADLEKDVKAMGIDTSKNKTDLEVRLPASPLGAGNDTQVILHLQDDGTVRSYGVWFHTDEIGSFGFPSEPADVIKLMDELWGPHKVIKDTLGDRKTWFDAKRGLRVSAEMNAVMPNSMDLDFVRYIPLANVFGAAGPVWGFEKPERPLIGATTDELTAAYGKKFVIKDTSATLTLLPTDYVGDTAVTTILMFLDGNKVREWRFGIPFDDYEPARAEYEALLEAKFGKPKVKDEHFIYGAKPTVDVSWSKYTHEMDVEVSK